MGVKICVAFITALLIAPHSAARASEADNAIRLPSATQHSYDKTAIQEQRKSGYQPKSSSLRIISSGNFKIELRHDGAGHYSLVTPRFMGAEVGGEPRRGGGVFRFSWSTSN